MLGFIGRQAELERLAETLDQNKGRPPLMA